MTWSNSWFWALHSQLTFFIHFHTLSASFSLYTFIYLVYLGTWQVLAFLAYFFSSAEDVEACTAHDPRRSCQSKRKATGRLRAPKPVPSSEQVPRISASFYRSLSCFRNLSNFKLVSKCVQMMSKLFPQWSKMEIPALPGSNGNAVFLLVCKIIGIVLMVSVYCTLLGHVREAWRTNYKRYKDTVWRSKVL